MRACSEKISSPRDGEADRKYRTAYHRSPVHRGTEYLFYQGLLFIFLRAGSLLHASQNLYSLPNMEVDTPTAGNTGYRNNSRKQTFRTKFGTCDKHVTEHTRPSDFPENSQCYTVQPNPTGEYKANVGAKYWKASRQVDDHWETTHFCWVGDQAKMNDARKKPDVVKVYGVLMDIQKDVKFIKRQLLDLRERTSGGSHAMLT